MKTYREFLGEVLNGNQSRERVEWTNTWIDNASNSTPLQPYNANIQPRILIIGDSTARMVRSTLAKTMECPVDMIGTSSNLYDELFVNLIDSFFNNSIYHYNVIFVQIGHHGRTGIDGGAFTDKDLVRYKDNMNCLLDFLRQYCRNIIVETIFDAVIPASRPQQLLIRLNIKGEKPDNKINSITQAKNRVLFTICQNTQCHLLDINSYMNNQRYLHIDHIHFERRAKKVIAKRMKEEINKLIE